MDALAAALADCKARGVQPKMIYTIPTVQNPTATIMPEARRAELLRLSEEYGVAVFEDDCYSDLIWNGQRPPALYAMSKAQNVIHMRLVLEVDRARAARRLPRRAVADHVAHAAAQDRCRLRRGRADAARRILRAAFRHAVPVLRKALRAKVETLMETLNEQFGTAAEFEDPKGGIFLWVKLPDNVDTMKLYQAALKEGVAINPGQRVVDRQGAQRRRGCASASRARRTSRSARASRSWPTCAGASSACRRAAAMWSGA